jgi:hypothetical protein
MSNWDAIMEFFAGGIPFAEYIWVPIIVGISLTALYVAKRMVSDV